MKKNVCDRLLNIILGMDKSKDTDNAKKDLADMKIRKELHLFTQCEKLMKWAARQKNIINSVISSNQLSFLTIFLRT